MFKPKPGDMVRYEKGGRWFEVRTVRKSADHTINNFGTLVMRDADILQLRPAEETLMELRKWHRAKLGWAICQNADGFRAYAVVVEGSLAQLHYEAAKSERLALLRLKRKVKGHE